MEQLAEQGLGELMADFRERKVPAGRWFRTRPGLVAVRAGGHDLRRRLPGDVRRAKLRRLEAEYRITDCAHVASGASRLRWKLAERWRAALSEHPRQADLLRSLLKDGRVTPRR